MNKKFKTLYFILYAILVFIPQSCFPTDPPKEHTNFSDNNKSYILAVGEQAKNRLQLSESTYGSYSKILFKQLGLNKGNKVLIIGCGTGENLEWMSKKVGNQGQIWCTDISNQQLEVAKKTAKHLPNMYFKQVDVTNIEQANLSQKYDFVTSRFVLVHLNGGTTTNIQAIKNMASLVKPGGHLVCEEQDTGFIFSYPENNSVNTSKQLLKKISEQKNVDYEYGRKLFHSFYQAGLKAARQQMNIPTFTHGSEKTLLALSLNEGRANYVNGKLITNEDMELLLTDLNQFNQNSQTLFAVGGFFQVWIKM